MNRVTKYTTCCRFIAGVFSGPRCQCSCGVFSSWHPVFRLKVPPPPPPHPFLVTAGSHYQSCQSLPGGGGLQLLTEALSYRTRFHHHHLELLCFSLVSLYFYLRWSHSSLIHSPTRSFFFTHSLLFIHSLNGAKANVQSGDHDIPLLFLMALCLGS